MENGIPVGKEQNIVDIDEDKLNQIAQQLDRPLDLSEVVTNPNVTTIDDIVREVNGKEGTPAVSSIFGSLVDPGKLGIVLCNGQVTVVGPGRYICPNPRAGLKKIVALTENPIECETLTIVRVQRGEYGLAVDGGQPIILGEGLHVRNSRLFQHKRFIPVNQQHIQHGSIHIIRVPKGMFALITENNVPKLLAEGVHITNSNLLEFHRFENANQPHLSHGTIHLVRVAKGQIAKITDNNKNNFLQEGTHFINSNTFKFVGMADLNQLAIHHGTLHLIRVPKGKVALVSDENKPKLLEEGTHFVDSNTFEYGGLADLKENVIKHGTIHLIRVSKGQVALVIDENKPKFLEEGTHLIDSTTFKFVSMADLSEQVIRHGTITRFRVRKGEVGLAWEDNKPVFYDEGIFEKDSPNFSFERCVNASEKQITLGSKKIITVWDGEVGVSFLKGKLNVLYPDRHIIESAEHIFQGFLSTQQQCLHLVQPKDKERDLLTCETKDFVEIGIKADVFYRIANAEKVLLIVGKDNVMPLVRETSIATLNAIIRSTSLAEVAQSKEVTAKSEKNHVENVSGSAPSAPLFFDKVHDEFISKLHDSFIDRYGIEICNIRIESFKIINQELAANISKQALVTAQTETQLANLASQTEIATAQQRRDADLARIKAEGDAMKLKLETESKSKATMELARADAEATLTQAKAQSQALELKAEAEAKAILLKADAESKRADMLSKTALGSQISMFQLYADMVKGSMQGVEKVIYLPTDAANNPFSFMSLQQGGMQNFGLPVQALPAPLTRKSIDQK